MMMYMFLEVFLRFETKKEKKNIGGIVWLNFKFKLFFMKVTDFSVQF